MRIALITLDEPPAPLRIGESTLWVRRLSIAAARNIEREARRAVPRPMNGQPDPEALPTLMQQIEDARLDYVLVRWDGLEGDPPCTLENKRNLPGDVREAILRLANSITRQAVQAQETGTKNSDAPSDTPAA